MKTPKETPHSVIRAIVFDYGGVIELSRSGHPLQRVAAALGVEYREFRDEYFKHNHLANVQNIKWNDMIMKVASVFGKGKKAEARIPAIIEDYQAKREINAELLSFFAGLKRQGFKVAIFSNASSELRGRLHKKGIIELVDVAVISGEIGHQKPHKEGFEVLFKKLNVRPNEVIFIDDSLKSLEKASEIGYIPILFKDNEQLKADLKKHGIFIDKE